MKVRLKDADLQEILVENTYPNRFSSTSEGGITERVFSAQLIGGKGSYREIFMENIHIGYGNMHMDRLTQLGFESDMETVELHFALQGNAKVEDHATKQTYQFGVNQHNIVYASNFRGLAFYAPCQNIQVFEINLTPGFFKRFLPEGKRCFFAFLQSLDRKETSMLSHYHYPITQAMHLLIQEILNCNRKGIFKRMYLEAKVMELLLLQLEQILSITAPPSSSLKKKDVEKMYAVRKYLAEHLGNSYTLMQLAQQFETNEYTLKKGFKEVFGTTVFNYWNTVKMNHAKRMLLDEKLTVNEVSDRIGYKNAQHFTTAFKRRFGYTPGKLRRV
ncbi:MAG: AraC family transcriptional regulator [Bacteroidota bacterium]